MPDDTPGRAPAPDQPQRPHHDLVADRRAKLAKLRNELHLDPRGQATPGLISLAAARTLAAPQAGPRPQGADSSPSSTPAPADPAPIPPPAPSPQPPAPPSPPTAAVAGRVVLHRDIGKLVFMTLRDDTADLQIAVNKREVADTTLKVAKLTDIGDLVVVRGYLAPTKTGELTLWARDDTTTAPAPEAHGVTPWASTPAFTIASKSLTPPPSEYYGFADPEQRYRRRYIDLWANPQVMQLAKTRIAVVSAIRDFLNRKGFLEVETPMLQPIHGGAAARPFQTHHNALDIPLFLRIAPELYLKRLLVGGFRKVFEINRNFRNEGVSPRHNPEFTMLEAYEAFGSWQTMADLVEEMICEVALKVCGTLKIEHRAPEAPHENAGLPPAPPPRTINLTRPWRRIRMADLVEERTGWKFDKQPLSTQQIDTLRAANHGKDLKLTGTPAEQLVELYEKLIEPTLIDPCFVTHVPSVVIPLARENRDDPFFADVYELAINGVEISPGYSELNDPDVQEKHFHHQVGDRDEQQQMDDDFLDALRVGMPPAGGLGLGLDRLVMLLTGAPSIRDVILFPLMRPQ